MVDVETEIKELEEELKNTQYNKATEHHFGVIKAKIAKLRDKQEKRESSKKGGEGFAVKKSGDATVALLGFPSVGKSSLLNALTKAESKIAAYEFTTLDVIPGIMEYGSAKIQILDMPGIVKGASKGKGRGKEVLSIIRGADLIIILIDATNPQHYDALKKELFDAGVRINQKKPDVKIIKTTSKGISISSTQKLNLSKETIKKILEEMRINNADIVIRDNINIDQLIDIIEDNRAYIPATAIITKTDIVSEEQKQKIKEQIKPDLMISVHKKENIEELKKIIFEKLQLIRIYLKEAGKQADMQEPLIVRTNIKIKNICEIIHKDFVKRFKYAKIWGSSKFPGQIIRSLDRILKDKDIIEIHTR